MTEGVPQFRLVYKGTTIKAIAPLTVRIELAEPNKENMLSLFSLPVMPASFWKSHKLSDPLSTPPLQAALIASPTGVWGSMWSIPASKTTGRQIYLVNRGRWNFDSLRYDYYLDDNVAFEAFKAGAYDLRQESSAKKLGHPLQR
jgi:microcin C transport system substrate-binding protein